VHYRLIKTTKRHFHQELVLQEVALYPFPQKRLLYCLH